MKKYAILALVLVLACCFLTACRASVDTPDTTPSTQATTTPTQATTRPTTMPTTEATMDTSYDTIGPDGTMGTDMTEGQMTEGARSRNNRPY